MKKEQRLVFRDMGIEASAPMDVACPLMRLGLRMAMRREVEARGGGEDVRFPFDKTFEGGYRVRRYDAMQPCDIDVLYGPKRWSVAAGLGPEDAPIAMDLVCLHRKTLRRTDLYDSTACFATDDLRRAYDLLRGRREPLRVQLLGGYCSPRRKAFSADHVLRDEAAEVPFLRLGAQMRLAALCETFGTDGRVAFHEPVAILEGLAAESVSVKKAEAEGAALPLPGACLNVVTAAGDERRTVGADELPAAALLALLEAVEVATGHDPMKGWIKV